MFEKLVAIEPVHCVGVPSGMTQQAKVRLSEKVLENLKSALAE